MYIFFFNLFFTRQPLRTVQTDLKKQIIKKANPFSFLYDDYDLLFLYLRK